MTLENLRLSAQTSSLLRAVAHPTRLKLLGELRRVGPLTATQAGGRIGESPAGCSFHLRQLAKYGLVEEAGGGRGRSRPLKEALKQALAPALSNSVATDRPAHPIGASICFTEKGTPSSPEGSVCASDSMPAPDSSPSAPWCCS